MAYMVASANAGKKSRRLKLTDFVLPWGRKRRTQTSEDHLDIFRALAARQGADGHGRLDS